MPEPSGGSARTPSNGATRCSPESTWSGSTLAGTLEPAELRTLDSIHLATARLLGEDLGKVVTYDERMASAARGLDMEVSSPS